jgi:beta-lactamase superfamily II metal-dependent hydrolase
VIETAAGAQRQFGVATWTWLNPVPDRSYEFANDSSMVIQVRCAGQRALLCGDIQQEAMNDLLRDADSVRAEIVELPHHGSHHGLSEFFIDRVKPAVVMQSTGWTRWRRDQWAGKLNGIQRLVTARDGACWVEIGPDGRIETGRFLKHGLVAGAGPD